MRTIPHLPIPSSPVRRHAHQRRGLLAALGVLLLAAGCSDPVTPIGEPWRAVQLDDALVEGYTDFGFELFRALTAEEADANVFVSPTSAAFALAMTYNGAAGETRDAMARTLGVDGMTREQVNDNNRRWLASLTAPSGRVELSLANSLWIRAGYPVEPDFLERNRTFYEAEVAELHFASPDASKRINDWVERQTRGKIDRIVGDAIPAGVVMYLINALYFKGDWTYQFDRADTHDAPFHHPDGTTRTVPMMSQTRGFDALEREDVRAVSLPYGNGRFAMVLALPAADRGLSDLVASLDAARWAGWMAALEERELTVSLPRFTLEWESSLKPALGALGMGIAFGAGEVPHDFTSMSPANPYIDDVLQKTFVEVNEEGTTAAAVTRVSMRESAPAEIRFDRPFLFAIYDHATRTVLFLGQVTDPG